jgi:hypothetical protein
MTVAQPTQVQEHLPNTIDPAPVVQEYVPITVEQAAVLLLQVPITVESDPELQEHLPITFESDAEEQDQNPITLTAEPSVINVESPSCIEALPAVEHLLWKLPIWTLYSTELSLITEL